MGRLYKNELKAMRDTYNYFNAMNVEKLFPFLSIIVMYHY